MRTCSCIKVMPSSSRESGPRTPWIEGVSELPEDSPVLGRACRIGLRIKRSMNSRLNMERRHNLLGDSSR